MALLFGLSGLFRFQAEGQSPVPSLTPDGPSSLECTSQTARCREHTGTPAYFAPT